MKSIQAAIAIIFFAVAFAFTAVGAAGAQEKNKTSNVQNNVHVELIEFETMDDYSQFDNHAAINIDAGRFNARLEKEIADGETKIIARTAAVISRLGMPTRISAGINNNRRAAGALIIIPQLIGGDTDETSSIVAARLAYESAVPIGDAPDAAKNLNSLDSTFMSDLGAVSVIGGGYQNISGRFVYFAIRFTR